MRGAERGDAVYDVGSWFPIVERDGKFAYFDTESAELIPNKKEYSINLKTGKTYESSVKYMWFDDVEPYDEEKYGDDDTRVFTVTKDGMIFDISDTGTILTKRRPIDNEEISI